MAFRGASYSTIQSVEFCVLENKQRNPPAAQAGFRPIHHHHTPPHKMDQLAPTSSQYGALCQ